MSRIIFRLSGASAHNILPQPARHQQSRTQPCSSPAAAGWLSRQPASSQASSRSHPAAGASSQASSQPRARSSQAQAGQPENMNMRAWAVTLGYPASPPQPLERPLGHQHYARHYARTMRGLLFVMFWAAGALLKIWFPASPPPPEERPGSSRSHPAGSPPAVKPAAGAAQQQEPPSRQPASSQASSRAAARHRPGSQKI